MTPQREIFWNIAYGEIIYVLGAIAVGALIYAIYRRYKYWRLGGPDIRFSDFGKRIWVFVITAVVDGIIHRKFFGIFDNLEHRRPAITDIQPKEFYPGITHFLIFAGTTLLLIGTALDVISHYIVHLRRGLPGTIGSSRHWGGNSYHRRCSGCDKTLWAETR